MTAQEIHTRYKENTTKNKHEKESSEDNFQENIVRETVHKRMCMVVFVDKEKIYQIE